MTYLTAAVVFVGLLCLLNLVLVLGVVKRLRQHSELLAGSGHQAPATMPEPGGAIGDFLAHTTGGAAVDRARLAGGTIVGFFSPGCAPCERKLPGFIRFAAADARPVLAVVVASAEEAGPTAEALSATATVVVEGLDGPVARAFGVDAFPTFCLVGDDHTIAAIGLDYRDLPAVVTA
ncbi:TlpA family protein disulfide reductase [Planomonospora venezuelensis]|uniref:Thiol-disulfide isomerase/thioredoxin n=1 Tax=Planomonospora venezuelensis TaxID=1999 RepID=A0A841CYJ3_PLAVE|nr:hypothetical protein [Planomonospora venezuelensis]MBB5962369.1 thiol-disulfide isomerase/thioredoxin [Planomonospora venezuelensis]GIN00750.1 hypothetical protein Pve01_24080 [Planomonospora venezuelensis]